LVCFVRDLREVHRLEQEFADQTRVLHQDKMMSLGKLAASLVHEINNPLSGILNYIRLMIRIVARGALSDEQRQDFQRYLDLVEGETDRCSQIVSNLLTFSRKSPATMAPVQIEELLHRCTLLSQHKLQLQDIRLETHIASEIPAVKGDLNQMQQCIINLIFNAIDAMPTGGTLYLSGDFDPDSEKVGIIVRDTGTGISQEDLPYIFEPFFSTKEEGYGVGLGLSTVFGIVEHHHGEVTVESREGEGTSFRLLFPV
jgi:two-component system, NtrC family, sensor kinase